MSLPIMAKSPLAKRWLIPRRGVSPTKPIIIKKTPQNFIRGFFKKPNF